MRPVPTDESLFDQIPIFPFESEIPIPEDVPGRRPRRSLLYDEPILRYVAYYRWVTVHQIVYRFFLYAGKVARPGFRTVKQLLERGLLTAELLDPDKGRASRQIVTLTDDGWGALGIHSAPKEPWRTNPGIVREFRLQFAETMLQRNVEGWRLVRVQDAVQTLREWGLSSYRGRSLTDTDRAYRDRLERWTVASLPVWLLRNVRTGEVRLGAPVRRGKSFQSLLSSLPETLSIFPTLHFEMVCAEPALVPKAEDLLRRWGERYKVTCTLHRAAYVRDRAYPSTPEEPGVSRYDRMGMPDPRTFTA